MKKMNVAIVGATGAVGTKILEKLLERDFPVAINQAASFETICRNRNYGRWS